MIQNELFWFGQAQIIQAYANMGILTCDHGNDASLIFSNGRPAD